MPLPVFTVGPSPHYSFWILEEWLLLELRHILARIFPGISNLVRPFHEGVTVTVWQDPSQQVTWLSESPLHFHWHQTNQTPAGAEEETQEEPEDWMDLSRSNWPRGMGDISP
jgi:hypothetical protein